MMGDEKGEVGRANKGTGGALIQPPPARSSRSGMYRGADAVGSVVWWWWWRWWKGEDMMPGARTGWGGTTGAR